MASRSPHGFRSRNGHCDPSVNAFPKLSYRAFVTRSAGYSSDNGGHERVVGPTSSRPDGDHRRLTGASSSSDDETWVRPVAVATQNRPRQGHGAAEPCGEVGWCGGEVALPRPDPQAGMGGAEAVAGWGTQEGPLPARDAYRRRPLSAARSAVVGDHPRAAPGHDRHPDTIDRGAGDVPGPDRAGVAAGVRGVGGRPPPFCEPACIPTGVPWRRRGARQVLPHREARSCCRHHGGVWHMGDAMALQILKPARAQAADPGI